MTSPSFLRLSSAYWIAKPSWATAAKTTSRSRL
eukprot:CAMPEP_0198649188 /NCGR_PEP_ID=MMETSP1467-20131203/4073_2 /TAXON_ID=1462469 /ORGANISM="unid. sp., Strain CCMP2135" /LENGTH=32 /DNA_ID= /DNA_START= /DNA_END= /DNA_ORIENTATION=